MFNFTFNGGAYVIDNPHGYKRWYFRFPFYVNDIGPIPAKNEIELRRIAREFEGVKRLPNGFECFRADSILVNVDNILRCRYPGDEW